MIDAASARSVFLLRPDNLGDLVLFSGALKHIRRHYANAEITICCKDYARDMLEFCPYVDRILLWQELCLPLVHRFPDFWCRDSLGTILHRLSLKLVHRTDVLLFPVRSPAPTHHVLVQSFCASQKFGIKGDYCNQLPANDVAAEGFYTGRLDVTQRDPWEHELSITRDFLRFLGAEVTEEQLWPEFWIEESDRVLVQKMVRKTNRTPLLGICPGVTSNAGKFYGGEKYAGALKSLGNRLVDCVILGSSADVPMCAEVAHWLRRCGNVSSLTDLSGQTTVRQLVEALRQCDVVIAQETAALHIAVALRKATLGIVGGGHFGRFYPWGPSKMSRVASRPLECYGCNWHCRYPVMRCIQEIAPSQIGRELESLLQVE